MDDDLQERRRTDRGLTAVGRVRRSTPTRIELLETVGLRDFKDKYPNQLSGALAAERP